MEINNKFNHQFWDSHCDTVRQLVGPKIFRRIEKIFDLPVAEDKYEHLPEILSQESSEKFHESLARRNESKTPSACSTAEFDDTKYENDIEKETGGEETDKWTSTSDVYKSSKSKGSLRTKSSTMRTMSTKYSSKSYDKHSIKSKNSEMSLSDSSISYLDDLIVHLSEEKETKKKIRPEQNPHFDMLYCNKSETDMIKWNSKYKPKTLQVSASDEFSKKAEILTKKIAKEFYEWWVGLGNLEFKSEIKRPEDIEDLFQVWFTEHASRGLVLDHKIIPCVLETIANYLGIKKASCSNVLKRQIAFDVHAETKPAQTVAFSKCLPRYLKHISPKNNTEVSWGPVKIPEDLRSMSCVWDDIQHLTSTKAFYKWLKLKQKMPMPPILKSLGKSGDKKQPFVMPSDYFLREKTVANADLALPVSEFTLELKEILSKLYF